MNRVRPSRRVWAVIDVCTYPRQHLSAHAVSIAVFQEHKIRVSPKYVYQIEWGIRGERDVETYGGGFGYCKGPPNRMHTFYPKGVKVNLEDTLRGEVGIGRCAAHVDTRLDGLSGVCHLLEDATLSPVKKELMQKARMFYEMGEELVRKALVG